MPPAAGKGSRLLCGAIVAMGPGLASCSVLVDWSGYSGDAGSQSEDAGDSGTGQDAGDAAAACAAKCGGCCDTTGFCAAGQSAATCGAGGQACQNCGARGLACNAGSCVNVPPEAGPPPMCVASQCTQCIPAIQMGCCKSDGTCGCQYVPAPGVPPGCR